MSLNQYIPSSTIFTVQAGDIITGSISFSNGPVSLQSQANTLMQALIGFDASPAPIALNGTFSLTLQGLSGIPPGPSPWTGTSSGALTASAATFTTPTNFSFSGFNYTINVTSVTPSGGGPQTSAGVRFQYLGLQRINLSIAGASATPEPTAVGLFAAGCGLLVWSRRRGTA